MKDPEFEDLEVDLTFYEKGDWDELWQKLLINCQIPSKYSSEESKAKYAINYANTVVRYLKSLLEDYRLENNNNKR